MLVSVMLTSAAMAIVRADNLPGISFFPRSTDLLFSLEVYFESHLDIQIPGSCTARVPSRPPRLIVFRGPCTKRPYRVAQARACDTGLPQSILFLFQNVLSTLIDVDLQSVYQYSF